MDIEGTLQPSSHEIDFLTQRINEETSTYGEAYPFGFFMKDASGQIKAGCNGSVIYGALYVDQLWVHTQFRGQGLGRQLMAHIHAWGRARGCMFSTVATMSFQGALGFYERLGYICEFQQTGYVQDAHKWVLRRPL